MPLTTININLLNGKKLKPFTFSNMKTTEITISDLNEAIHNREGISADNQRIIKLGKKPQDLKKNKLLSDYNIHDNDALTLVVKSKKVNKYQTGGIPSTTPVSPVSPVSPTTLTPPPVTGTTVTGTTVTGTTVTGTTVAGTTVAVVETPTVNPTTIPLSTPSGPVVNASVVPVVPVVTATVATTATTATTEAREFRNIKFTPRQYHRDNEEISKYINVAQLFSKKVFKMLEEMGEDGHETLIELQNSKKMEPIALSHTFADVEILKKIFIECSGVMVRGDVKLRDIPLKIAEELVLLIPTLTPGVLDHETASVRYVETANPDNVALKIRTLFLKYKDFTGKFDDFELTDEEFIALWINYNLVLNGFRPLNLSFSWDISELNHNLHASWNNIVARILTKGQMAVSDAHDEYNKKADDEVLSELQVKINAIEKECVTRTATIEGVYMAALNAADSEIEASTRRFSELERRLATIETDIADADEDTKNTLKREEISLNREKHAVLSQIDTSRGNRGRARQRKNNELSALNEKKIESLRLAGNKAKTSKKQRREAREASEVELKEILAVVRREYRRDIHIDISKTIGNRFRNDLKRRARIQARAAAEVKKQVEAVVTTETEKPSKKLRLSSKQRKKLKRRTDAVESARVATEEVERTAGLDLVKDGWDA